ncbi:hypothetical protein AYM39_00375 [Methylomonas sp. DH-1]|nr:hypothetical protein AYM39_00375 [Methylomonas sp. DH-1]
MPDLVKVGYTTRSPEERAKELGANTSVAVPFIVAFKRLVSNCEAVERMIHDRLAAKGFRVAENREFFRAPVSVVVDIILGLPPEILQVSPGTITESISPNLLSKESLPWIDLWRQAESLFYGLGDDLEDREAAKLIYLDAIKLGSSWPYFRLAENEFATNIDSNRWTEARRYAREGVAKGNYLCYLTLAKISNMQNDMMSVVKATNLLFRTRAEKSDTKLESILSFVSELQSLFFQAPDVLDNINEVSLSEIRSLISELLDECDRNANLIIKFWPEGHERGLKDNQRLKDKIKSLCV